MTAHGPEGSFVVQADTEKVSLLAKLYNAAQAIGTRVVDHLASIDAGFKISTGCDKVDPLSDRQKRSLGLIPESAERPIKSA